MVFINKDFNEELIKDDEFKDFDKLVKKFSELYEAQKDKPSVVNQLRLRQMEFVYSVLKKISKGKNARISYKLYEPFESMGSITIEGESIEICNPEWFARAVEFASNIEVYPLEKKAVRMTFTFHGLSKHID